MKTEEDINTTLRLMLCTFDNYRRLLDLTFIQAADKTLETYNDFFCWLNEKKK